MAGLSLQTGVRAGASYTPLTPAAAKSSTAPSNIGQAAYGISGSGAGNGPRTASYGSMAVGYIAIAALVYLWWSLPR